MTEVNEEEMYFFIADISGYTAFMLKNKMDYTHGTLIVTELMKALVKEVDVPMEISKLEGDAIFLFLLQDKASKAFGADLKLLSDKILHIFEVFTQKLNELQSTNDCQCGGCSNIDKLNLKIVAHYGKAHRDTIGSFHELSGVDVIIAHRLLKNQVKEKRYFLLTEEAYKKLPLPETGRTVKAEESDKDLGTLTVYVYYPSYEAAPVKKAELSPLAKFHSHFKLALGGLLLKLGLRKQPVFHNVPPV